MARYSDVVVAWALACLRGGDRAAARALVDKQPGPTAELAKRFALLTLI